MIFVIFFSKMKIFFVKDLTIKFLKVPKMADFEKNAKGGVFGFFYHGGQFFGHFSRDYACKFFQKKVKKWPKNGQKMKKNLKLIPV